MAMLATTVAGDISAKPASDLSGKSVLLTGCSSGFGRLAALHCARQGANVIASMRNLRGGKRPEAQELREIAASEGLKLSIVEIDVTDSAQVDNGVREAERIAGRALDAQVNNAGIGLGAPAELADMECLRLVFETNLFGYVRMARAVLPAMRARKQGLIVNVSSQLGRILIPNYGVYSGTKFGVEAIFETMAYELAPHGVEVSIIEPGGYPTKIWENGARYSNALFERTEQERKAAYSEQIEAARRMFAGGGATDPMDVPRAMAELIAMPPGSRPLRRSVHPDTRATDAVNAACAQVQEALLGKGPFAQWHKAVTS